MAECAHPLCGLALARCKPATTTVGCWFPQCQGWIHKRSRAHMGLDGHPASPKTAAPGIPSPPGAAKTAAAGESGPPPLEVAAGGGVAPTGLAGRAPSAAPAAVPRSGGAATPLTGQEWRDAVKRAQSALHRTQRNRRGRRPGPPITGVQWGGPR